MTWHKYKRKNTNEKMVELLCDQCGTLLDDQPNPFDFGENELSVPKRVVRIAISRSYNYDEIIFVVCDACADTIRYVIKGKE